MINKCVYHHPILIKEPQHTRLQEQCWLQDVYKCQRLNYTSLDKMICLPSPNVRRSAFFFTIILKIMYKEQYPKCSTEHTYFCLYFRISSLSVKFYYSIKRLMILLWLLSQFWYFLKSLRIAPRILKTDMEIMREPSSWEILLNNIWFPGNGSMIEQQIRKCMSAKSFINFWLGNFDLVSGKKSLFTCLT